MYSGKKDQREHKDSEFFVDTANGNKVHSFFYIILWQEVVGWKINLIKFAWILFSPSRVLTEIVPQFWTYINAFQVKKSVCFKLWVFYILSLFPPLFTVTCEHFCFFFCNLYPLFFFFFFAIKPPEMPSGMPHEFNQLKTGFLWPLFLWPHCAQSRISLDHSSEVSSWQSCETCSVRGCWHADICQISRMDPKAHNMLWRATDDIFSFTFSFIYTGQRMEFQHDPIKSKMLFQRLDYFFAELNHTSACKICNAHL